MTEQRPEEGRRSVDFVRLEFGFLLICWIVTMIALVNALIRA